MCQARRRPNPGSSGKAVSELVENQRIVARLAYELQDAIENQPEGLVITLRACERAITILLHRGVIEPVKRREPETPMIGQTTIDDHLSEADKAVGADGK